MRKCAFAIICLLLLSLTGISAKQRVTSQAELARKSDYLYLEALRQQNMGNADAYFMLVQRAFELNPTDEYLGLEHGFNRLRLSRGDTTEIAQGYALIKKYVQDNPNDFYTNLMMASIASDLDMTDDAMEVWKRLHYNFPLRPEVTVRYAEMLALSGDSANQRHAIELFDSLEVTEGPSMSLTSQKIRLYYQQHDTSAILNETHRLMDTSPRSAQFAVYAADIMKQFGTPDSALYYYNRAIDLDPSEGVAYYALANFYRERGDSVGYDREVFKALQQESLDLQPKIEIFRDYLSMLYTDTLQQPRINNLFSVLLEQNPHEVDLHTLYRDYLIALGNYEEAAEQASYALDINPADEDQWVALASLWLQVQNFEASLDAAERGIHYFPDNTMLYLIGSTDNVRLDQFDAAIAMLDRALQSPEATDYEVLSDIMGSKGDAFYAAGNRDSAFVYYQKAIDINPENYTAVNNCAYYMACEDIDIDKAEEMITTVVTMRPNEATSLDTYAWVLFKKKNYELAQEIIDKVLELDTEPSAELYEHAGDIYFMNRHPEKALEFWRQALKLDPDNDLLKRKVTHQTYFYE